MTPIFKIKPFAALSAAEVYQVLQLRSEVFVVEQNCVYQDIDGKDDKALHLIGTIDSKIVAYARLFAPGYYFDNASIGRVVVSPQYRAHKFGHLLMTAAIAGVETHFNTKEITISAQLYLKKFYEGHGFVQQGEGYLEDDIPHIRMDFRFMN
ncbi:GNAT family acetyltransferase [Flavobacterium akiainvivens]|uniref:GNAT family acetyltransferase n=1 Tax=Flavobacterium akiainvivens TaxID=1202724 RepID=A0A0M8MJE7_9FLAO|nr:GNAT family N-acetyltransferase [Flavobacterium akiainvivens]KOS07037.1 GNAT family acetyltransferase [Flavobacterium akiainvivens]SFQ58884.1 ElaA protein [Flavobacterium akiainvivens]